MRGIETGKARIRHEVFTEIARMAYEGGDYAKRGPATAAAKATTATAQGTSFT